MGNNESCGARTSKTVRRVTLTLSAVAVLLIAGVVTAGSSKEAGRGGQVEMKIYIMSQCPFSMKVLNAVIPMARELGGRFRLDLDYVGRDNSGNLSSMHGEDELQGNILQACVANHASYNSWLDFLECEIRDWRNIPQGWETCAQRAGVDVGVIRTCAQGGEGERLMAASFQRAQTAGARGTPTIFVAGARYSGGRSEQAFARAICAQYAAGTAPAYCGQIPPPPQVPVTVLTDRRCRRPECNIDTAVSSLKGRIPGAQVKRVDYRTRAGRRLFKQAELRLLPALVIGQEVKQDSDALRSLRSAKRVGDSYVEILGRFDPVKGRWAERPQVPVQFLVDARCKTRECTAIDRFESFIKRQVPNAVVTRVEYDTARGRALWRQVAAGAPSTPPTGHSPRPLGLPLALFGDSIELEEEAFGRLQRRFVKIGNQYMFQLGPWDPTAEICDNGIDDDHDGNADCSDSHCINQMICRREQRRTLQVFIMSQCPYGIRVNNAMREVLDNFGRDRSRIDYRIGYVGQVAADGTLSTMHGQAELEEDLREICAQHYYPDNYAFMEYIWCRNRNIRSSAWEQCVQAPLDVNVIRSCAEGSEGQRLLRASMELANDLGFRGSPSLLLNNRYEIRGRDAEAIKNEFCSRNPAPECANTLSGAPSRP